MRQLHYHYSMLKLRHKSAKSLAKMAGVSESTMSRVLRGKGDLDSVAAQKLAAGLEDTEPGQGVAFFIRYLRAQLPKRLKDQIKIQWLGASLPEESTTAAATAAQLSDYLKLCETALVLPRPVQSTLQQFAEFCLAQPDRSQLILGILPIVIEHYRRLDSANEQPPTDEKT